MTAYTTYSDGSTITAKGGANAAGFPSWVVFENVFDASKRNLVQNDVAAVLSIPAGTLIMGVHWEVETVEGASRNFAIGDGSDTNGFIETTDGNTLASGATALALTEAAPDTVTGYSAGKYYSAADTLDVLAVTSGGLTALKLRVKAYGFQFGV